MAAGFKILDSSKTPLDFSAMLYEMDRSVFCLAATGAGWGIRFKLAAMMRCIPVIIADGVQVRRMFPTHTFPAPVLVSMFMDQVTASHGLDQITMWFAQQGSVCLTRYWHGSNDCF
jgi:hypothetical protein